MVNQGGVPKPLIFDASVLQHDPNIPKQFIWPDHEKPAADPAPQLAVPLIDLAGFLSGDPAAALQASTLVGEACKKHGFFLVANHGVDASLISHAHRYMDHFFELPLSEKQKAERKVGDHCGYASSFIGRFSSKLPWKETLSFSFSADKSSHDIVVDYFKTTLGPDFSHIGKIYQEYCNAMSNLSFRDNGAFGDEFGRLSNGRYKSCFAQGSGEQQESRKSLAFFLCPKKDKVVRPPTGTGGLQQIQEYIQISHGPLLEFTPKHYRADMNTLQSFPLGYFNPGQLID
nr:gibberellin 20 oxidase 1-D-like [Ipomoea batatas]